MQQDLLLHNGHENARQLLPYGGSAMYHPVVFTPEESERYFRELITTIAWRQEYVQFYGKRYPIPRQTAWFGDPGKAYTYSKISNAPEQWTPTLLEIKARVEKLAGVVFNSVLINRYRNGSDSVAWHADDEHELGLEPTIGSVSFGATRKFQFRSSTVKEDGVTIPLENGSVIIMSGASQKVWKHQVPKERGNIGERLNLTFRVIDERNHASQPLR